MNRVSDILSKIAYNIPQVHFEKCEIPEILLAARKIPVSVLVAVLNFNKLKGAGSERGV